MSRAHEDPTPPPAPPGGIEPRGRQRPHSPEANARLTAMTAVALLVLLAAEGVTVLRVHRLLTPHVLIGMVLVPVVVLKTGSTLWRFARYYSGDRAYRHKGPPPLLLRLLGPFVVVLTFAVLGTGIVLLLWPAGHGDTWLFMHKATFVLWFGAMTIHVLGHLLDTGRLAPADFSRRTRAQVRGASARQWVLVASLVAGVLLAVAVAPKIGAWHLGGLGAEGAHTVAPASHAAPH